MKLLKKIVAMVLTATFVGTSISLPVFAAENSNTDMDNLDVLIAAHNFLVSEDLENNLWPTDLSEVEIVPLYDLNSQVIAYYLAVPGAYAVINNNIENPVAIEFGDGDNYLIREILDVNNNPHIVYNNPFDLYDQGDELMTISGETEKDYYKYYPDSLKKNRILASIHSENRALVKNMIANVAVPLGDGDYGFISGADMPTIRYTSDVITGTNVDWVITKDFSGYTDHCAATSITNLAIYFAGQGYDNLYKGSDTATFSDVVKICPDGATPSLSGSVAAYFSSCGYTAGHSGVGNMSDLKDAVTKDRPCAMLLADGIVTWHWILGLGWREYISGDQYIQVMDNWRRTTNRYYNPGDGSLWVSAREYWVN